jgi:two-component system, NtrC family, sensor histidine kinase KinB
MDSIHSLLKRQLKRHIPDPDALPPTFLEAVNQAYRQFDADRAMLERSLELTSQELLQSNVEIRRAYDELQREAARTERQVAELRVLHAIAAASSEATDEHTFVGRAVAAITIFYRQNLGILLVDETSQALRPHPASWNRLQTIGLAAVPLGTGITGQVASSGMARLIADVTEEPGYLVGFSDTRSELCVPIKVGQRVIGVLNVESDQPAAFSADDERFLTTIADQMATAIEKLRLLKAEQEHVAALHDAKEELELRVAERTVELRRANEQLHHELAERRQIETELRTQKQLFENLVAFARAASERPILEDTLENVLAVAVGLTEAQGGSLFLLDEGGKVTHSALIHPTLSPAAQLDLAGRVMDQGLAGWVAQYRLPALLPETDGDPRWQALDEGSYTPHSALAVPILGGPILLGVLTLSQSDAGHFNEDHLRLMQAAADQMALAVRNAQIFEAVRRMADRQITLYDVLRAVGGQLNPQAVAWAAVDAIAHFVGWQHVGIALPTEDGQGWVSAAAKGFLISGVGMVLARGQGIIGRAFRTGDTQYVPNVQHDPDYYAGPTNITRSELAVPMRRGERIMGVLNVESDRPEDFNTEDLILAESLAGAVALALDNARLYSEIEASLADLSTLIAASRDGIIFVNLEGLVRVVNVAALHLMGLSDQPAGWINRPVWEAITTLRHSHPTTVKMILAELRQSRLDLEHSGEAEYQVSARILHLITVPVRAAESLLGRLFVLRDVTEERLLEKLRDDLTHTMVHDLRNPLAAISMSLQMLASRTGEALPAEQRRMLTHALNRTRQMTGLVNAILDVSQLESGQVPLRCQSFSLAALVTDTWVWQAALAAEKEISLEYHISDQLPLISADPDLLQRILENLVGNAIKFTPAGGCIHLSADLVADPPGPAVVHVIVSDSGPGIEADLQNRLFQKFVAGRQPGKGSGLGLAFCRLAVEAHGGRIWVENVPGGGAAFHFTLPAVV